MLADLPVFEGLSTAGIAGLLLVYLVAFGIRGMIGFGSVTPAVLLAALLVPPHKAVLLALITSAYAQVQLVPQGLRDGDWRIVRPLFAGSVLSIVVGAWVFANISASWLAVVMGVFLGFAVVADRLRLVDLLSGYLKRHPVTVPFWLSTVAGLLSTIAGGGMIYFLSVYTKWATPSPVVFRGTNILISALSNLWRTAVFALAGLIDLSLLVEGLILLPSTLAGSWIGGIVARKTSPERFYEVVRLLLLLAALVLVWKGVRDVAL